MTAQQKFLLRGQVVDAANDSPVSFATTALLRDSTAVAAVARRCAGAVRTLGGGRGRLPPANHHGGLQSRNAARHAPHCRDRCRYDPLAAGRGHRPGDGHHPETARHGRRRENDLLGRRRSAGRIVDARRDPAQSAAADHRRRGQREAQRAERFQGAGQRTVVGDVQEFQGRDPQYARLADQEDRSHHRTLDEIRRRRCGRHHQHHHRPQGVRRLQRQPQLQHGTRHPPAIRRSLALRPEGQVRRFGPGVLLSDEPQEPPLHIGKPAREFRLRTAALPHLRIDRLRQGPQRIRHAEPELPTRYAQPRHPRRIALDRRMEEQLRHSDPHVRRRRKRRPSPTTRTTTTTTPTRDFRSAPTTSGVSASPNIRSLFRTWSRSTPTRVTISSPTTAC